MKHIFLLTAILISFATNLFAAAWTGSTSEPENMKKIDGKAFYVITTADELAWFAAQVNGGKTTINAVLNNDIVFGTNTSTTCSKEWTPIGKDSSHIFNGIIDGGNHSIFGLYIKDLKFVGLVGVMGVNGIVKNLTMGAGSYSSSKGYVGGVVGVNSGKIESVINKNVISGNNVGGCVGWNGKTGSLLNVQNFAKISAWGNGGGIAFLNEGSIFNVVNKGVVSASISLSCAVKSVSQIFYVGGVVSENKGSIEKTSNEGDVGVSSFADGCRYSTNGGASWFTSTATATTNEGGIVGVNRSSAKILKSSNLGTITYSGKGGTSGGGGTSKGIVGSVVGKNEGQIENTYNTTSKLFFGENSGKLLNSYCVGGLAYWINNSKKTATVENMKKDQFAWVLNTSEGSSTNSKIWSRNDGYPTFANDSYKAIYKVVFNDDGVTSNRYTNNKGLVTFPEDPEPAEGYIFSGWYNANDTKVKPTTVFTADQTVKAVYTDASNIFWTINFYNAAPADTILEAKSYQHGSIVTYGGAEPTLAATAKYTYKFKGWDVEPTNAVEDFDYHAVYDSIIRSYTIVFNNSDGSKIESATFEYGKMPSCSKTPTRAATAEWKYTHKGWKPALDYVTEEASYTAIYDSVKVEYKVTFMNGVDVIDEQMVPYGDAAVAPTNVTREGYKFVGWNTSFAKVTENLTVKALFEELIIRTVSVVNGDGEKIDDKKVEDCEKYTLPEAPKKDGYTFDAYYDGDKKIGVAGDEIVVSGNVTIIAKYIKNPESSSSVVKSSSSSAVVSSSSVIKSSSSSKLVSSSSVKLSSSSVAKSSSSSAKSSSSSVKSSSSTKVSSSSKAKSSSSSIKSSSSKKSDALIVTAVPKFSVVVLGRNLQVANAKVGATYVLFDMQGKVLMQDRVASANFNVAVPRSGNYLLKIGDRTQRVTVK